MLSEVGALQMQNKVLQLPYNFQFSFSQDEILPYFFGIAAVL